MRGVGVEHHRGARSARGDHHPLQRHAVLGDALVAEPHGGHPAGEGGRRRLADHHLRQARTQGSLDVARRNAPGAIGGGRIDEDVQEHGAPMQSRGGRDGGRRHHVPPGARLQREDGAHRDRRPGGAGGGVGDGPRALRDEHDERRDDQGRHPSPLPHALGGSFVGPHRHRIRGHPRYLAESRIDRRRTVPRCRTRPRTRIRRRAICRRTSRPVGVSTSGRPKPQRRAGQLEQRHALGLDRDLGPGVLAVVHQHRARRVGGTGQHLDRDRDTRVRRDQRRRLSAADQHRAFGITEQIGLEEALDEGAEPGVLVGGILSGRSCPRVEHHLGCLPAVEGRIARRRVGQAAGGD